MESFSPYNFLVFHTKVIPLRSGPAVCIPLNGQIVLVLLRRVQPDNGQISTLEFTFEFECFFILFSIFYFLLIRFGWK